MYMDDARATNAILVLLVRCVHGLKTHASVFFSLRPCSIFKSCSCRDLLMRRYELIPRATRHAIVVDRSGCTASCPCALLSRLRHVPCVGGSARATSYGDLRRARRQCAHDYNLVTVQGSDVCRSMSICVARA